MIYSLHCYLNERLNFWDTLNKYNGVSGYTIASSNRNSNILVGTGHNILG